LVRGDDELVNNNNDELTRHSAALIRHNTELANNFTIDEVNVSKKGLLGKLKVGFKYLGSGVQINFERLDSVYVHYQEVAKRHLF